uniref:Uncharacterized protein n=1 Tax=Anguilla anguilla TaxID=7936 RepID=A0A0E9P5M6_ANGAN
MHAQQKWCTQQPCPFSKFFNFSMTCKVSKSQKN